MGNIRIGIYLIAATICLAFLAALADQEEWCTKPSQGLLVGFTSAQCPFSVRITTALGINSKDRCTVRVARWQQLPGIGINPDQDAYIESSRSNLSCLVVWPVRILEIGAIGFIGWGLFTKGDTSTRAFKEVSHDEQERKVLQLLEQGLSNQEIADKLGSSTVNIALIKSELFSKFGVTNDIGLLNEARRSGFITPESDELYPNNDSES